MDPEYVRQLERDNARLRRELAGLRPAADAQRPPTALDQSERARLGAATLDALIAALPDYLFVIERGSMRILYCNDTFAYGLGHPGRSAIEGRTIFECFAPAEAAHFARQNEQVFTTGQTLHEVETITLGERSASFDTYKIPLFSPEGLIIALLGTARDISPLVEARQELRALNTELEQRIADRTAELQAMNQRLAAEIAERVTAEHALRQRDASYRLISEHTSDLIVLLDLDAGATIRYASPSHLRVLGHIPAAGSRGVAVHPDERAEAARMLRECAVRGRAEGSMRVQAVDGGYRWVEVRMTSFVQEGRQMAVSVSRDVTERRQLEAQLFQSQKLEGIGRLAGGVAHDFNNLLVVISGSVDLARGSLPAEHPAQADLQAIELAAGRAADLTRQLLTFARHQGGAPQSLSLNHLIGQLRQLLRRLLREDVQITELLSPDLWPVRGDPSQLEQVLVNLVANAQDALPAGGTIAIATANVTLDGSPLLSHPQLPAGPYVLLTVSDNGVGMSEQVRRQALEPFFTTKPVGKGTGLGLSTCYGIVVQHGGGIHLSSEVAQGTVVKIYLPRTADAPDQPPPAGPAAQPRGDETVLLVEDEPSVRGLAARVLRGQGYTVLEATGGEEALRIAAAAGGPIDLLLTDTVMPGMSGLALAEQLRSLRPDLAILVMSGYNGGSLADPPAGSDQPLLQKPFTPASLARAVRAALDARGRRPA